MHLAQINYGHVVRAKQEGYFQARHSMTVIICGIQCKRLHVVAHLYCTAYTKPVVSLAQLRNRRLSRLACRRGHLFLALC